MLTTHNPTDGSGAAIVLSGFVLLRDDALADGDLVWSPRLYCFVPIDPDAKGVPASYQYLQPVIRELHPTRRTPP